MKKFLTVAITSLSVLGTITPANSEISSAATTSSSKPYKVATADTIALQVNKGNCQPNSNGFYYQRGLSLDFLKDCYEYCRELDAVEPNEPGWLYAGKYSRYEYFSKRDQKNCRDTWFRLMRRHGSRVTIEKGVTSRLENGQVRRYINDFPVSIECRRAEYWNDNTGWSPIVPNTVIDDMYLRFCR